MPTIIKESAKGELEESMFRVLSVLQFLDFFVLLRITVAKFVRVDGVKVGGVGGITNVGDIRWVLFSHRLKVDPVKERVGLDVISSVQAQALLGATTQPHNQVHGWLGEVGLARNLERFFPVYHLHRAGTSMSKDFPPGDKKVNFPPGDKKVNVTIKHTHTKPVFKQNKRS